MSDYYDINKPFSIENWNDLIEDVNDILQNPDGVGPGCEPIEPLEKVKDPHIWAVKDVEELREKLQETCNSITFSEKLEIWRPGIIDEIEEQMEDAWCDCDDREPEITSCGGFTMSTLLAGATEERCCGQKVLSLPCVCGYCHRSTYIGPWYPPVYTSNQGIEDNMDSTYHDAASAEQILRLHIAWMLQSANRLEVRQGDVDSAVAVVDAGIAFYEANCKKTPPEENDPTCPQVLSAIRTNGEIASDLQEKVDDELVRWNGHYDKVMGALTAGNSAAYANWSSALSLEGRYPDDVNHISECFDSVLSSGLDWYTWWNPYSGKGPKIPTISVWTKNEHLWGADGRSGGVEIRVSPGGTPYAVGGVGSQYGSNRYTLTYYESKFETLGLPCTTWRTISDFGKIWYRDIDGRIFAPLVEPNPDDYGSYEPIVEVTKPGGAGQDHTDKQEEWYDTYLNWYEEHPAYDDRHESY